ncbi:MAG: hypothetical protein GY899_08665 [Verrucomicrobiaceae bacterium]|nr:hypothetical protein [Verrucomicrobiaceae bacterium]
MPESEENKHEDLPRVLIAHEEVGTLRLIREALENFTPCRVDTTPNAEYAFELALQREYHLYMFGLGLPVIDGELLYGLLAKAVPCCQGGVRSCPGVIYLADPAHSSKAEILQREARVKGVLIKPLTVDRIIAMVKGGTPLKGGAEESAV